MSMYRFRDARLRSAALAASAATLITLLVACTPPLPATVTLEDQTKAYTGSGVQVEVGFQPEVAGASATITYTPAGGAPLPAGTLPVDVGTYEVVAVAGHGFEGEARATLTITRGEIVIRPDPNQRKRFGEADPVLTFTVDGGLPSDVELSGALARASGEDPGQYDFRIGSLAAGRNFALELAADAPRFVIDVAEANVQVPDRVVTYNGFAHAALPVFTPPQAAVGSEVTYQRAGHPDWEGPQPVDVGIYRATVTLGEGFAVSGDASGTIEIRPRDVIVRVRDGLSCGDIRDPDADHRVFYSVEDALLAPAGIVGALAVNGSEITLGTLEPRRADDERDRNFRLVLDPPSPTCVEAEDDPPSG